MVLMLLTSRAELGFAGGAALQATPVYNHQTREAAR
jgi:hypothetical protein